MGWIVAIGALLVTAGAAGAQGLPTEPLTFAGSRVTLSADVSATFAAEDPGFFNYTDYEYSALRNVRLGLAAEVRASRRLSLLGEVRLDHGDRIQPFGFYARFRPWPSRRLDIQAGRIPPTFGALGRGSYGRQNLVIGVPLAYQYLVSLRPDALPATADDLLRMRGRGWLSAFPLGNPAPDRGLPIVNAARWDTGVQVHAVHGPIEWTAAVTTGSLSNPRLADDNDGRQYAGRVVARPTPSLALGVSLSRGAFLDRDLAQALPAGRNVADGIQRAIGVDGEYAVGRFLARAEVITSQWRLPLGLSAAPPEPLGATATLAEARYRVLPGVQFAARVERLDFSRLTALATRPRWEAPVRRLELGASYSLTRNITAKASWQRNTRDGGRVRRDTLTAIQVLYWF